MVSSDLFCQLKVMPSFCIPNAIWMIWYIYKVTPSNIQFYNLLISFTDVLGDGCIKKGSFCPTKKILKSENIGNKIIEFKDFSNVSGSVVQLRPQKVELNLIPKYKQKVDFDVSVS